MLNYIYWLVAELFWPYLTAVILCCVYAKCSSVNSFIRSGGIKQNVLLVTAHPDDECMFFTPTILSLLKEGHKVFLVCLSKGDADGLGDTRKKELVAACVKLGILQSRVTVVDDERFKDGMETRWDVNELGEVILSVAKRVNANSIVTFDDQGVSGHLNHIAIFKAVQKLYRQQQLEDISIFTLETTSLFRKYLSFLDIPLSCILCYTSFVNIPSDVLRSWKAMASHDTQMVWFRKLYVVFSRYLYVNTLQEMK